MDPSLSNVATAKADKTSLRSLPSPPGSCALPATTRNRSEALEIVEINLYGPADAASVTEDGRIGALGHSPVKLPPGESITVDFGYVRYPLGALIEWGETYGTVFSAHLSDDGENFREMGRIATGNGGSDSFWWRSTTSRYFRLTVHEASSPAGAVVNELKLRILNKDRMPIGQLERAALAGRGDLYPQSLLGRQVYWTALGEYDQAEEALFDEYGNLEPRRGSPQITPLLRVDGALHGAPASPSISQSLVDGSLPIPTVAWSAQDIELRVTALAHAGEALAEHRIVNRSAKRRKGALVLAVRPVQINPYWQHGGHADNRRHRRRRPAGASQRPTLCRVFGRPRRRSGRRLRRRRRDQAHREGAATRPRGAFARTRPSSARACEFSFSLAPGERCRNRRLVADEGRRRRRTRRRPSTLCARPSRGIGGRRSARARSQSATGK